MNFTGVGYPGDRYFHLGSASASASAGCFTNVFSGENDREWNTIANKQSKARLGANQLYVGDITFDIPNTAYGEIKKDLLTTLEGLDVENTASDYVEARQRFKKVLNGIINVRSGDKHFVCIPAFEVWVSMGILWTDDPIL